MQQSWACKTVYSKSNLLVCTRKCQAKREPSLVVSIVNISWLMVSLLALTKQKQQAK
jgi:hypothetical protein